MGLEAASVKRSGPGTSREGGRVMKNAERKRQMIDDASAEVTAEELRDFLAADFLEVPENPEFKERLRAKLWELVQEYARTADPEPEHD